MSRVVELHSPAIGAAGRVVVHGHYGRPVRLPVRGRRRLRLPGPRDAGNYEFGDTAEVAAFHGDHLDCIRSRASFLLVCGQGMWENTTGRHGAPRSRIISRG